MALAIVATLGGCGARSGLLEPLQDEVQAGGSGAGGMAGSGGRAGQGGTFPVAGAPSVGGLPSFGGTSNVAGSPGIAGVAGVAGEAGMPSTCTLSFTDCAGPHEPECAGQREACSGYVPWVAPFVSSEAAYLTDVATGRDGRVAVTGYHTGATSVPGSSGAIVSPPGAEQALLASFSTRSTDVQDVRLEWAYADEGEATSRGVSVEMALNGDAVLQTQRSTGFALAGALVRLNVTGEPTFREYSGTSKSVTPKALGMDNDGRIWSGGVFVNDIDYQNVQINAGGGLPVGYLLQVDYALQRLQLVPSPNDYLDAEVSSLAVDDEDHVLVVARINTPNVGQSFLLRKLAVDGSVVFEKAYRRNLIVSSVVVDRNMRSTVFGYFSAAFANEGQVFTTKGVGLFVAQYSREGVLLWQHSFDGNAQASAAAVDPNGNLALTGYATELVLSDRTLVAEHQQYPDAPAFAFVLKLRPDGTEVWAKSCDGNFVPSAVAADNAGTIWLAGTVSDVVWCDESGFSSGTSRPTGLLARFIP